MSEPQSVEIDLDKLRERMRPGVISEAAIDLAFALIDSQALRLQQVEFKATILQAQIGGWEAACALQVAVLQDVQSYLYGARYNVDTLKRRIEEATETNAGQTLLAQLWRAEGVATAAAIALSEIDTIGAIQPHTRSMLQAGLDAFEAGKARAE